MKRNHQGDKSPPMVKLSDQKTSAITEISSILQPSKALHRSKKSLYSTQIMRMAYDSVQSEQHAVGQAAAMFKVPYGALNKKQSDRELKYGKGAGRPLEIGAEKEQKLADYLFVSGRWGHGLSRREILELTGEFLREENIKTRWINGIPGFDWLRNFLKRHPQVMACKDEVWSARQMNSLHADGLYRELEHLYEEEKVTSNESHRFYSLLEISLSCEEQSDDLEILQNDPLKASVLTCICADGDKLPPLVVFQGKCMTCEKNPNCNGTLNKNTAERALFCYWFENIFLPMLPRSEKSIILFFEGHSLQINLKILKLAKRNSVFFVKFPPDLAGHFQPLDFECSSALKSAHDKHLQIWKKKNLQNIEDIQREKLGNIIGKTWKKSVKKNVITKGFERTGLFPLDKSKFNENVFPEPSLKKFKEWKEAEFPKSINETIGILKSGIDETKTIADSHDLPTPKITHVTSVPSKAVTSSQYSISPKGNFLNQFPSFVPNESSKSNLNSESEEEDVSGKEERIALTAELRSNGTELSIEKMLQDGADEAITEAVELNNDNRCSGRIFKIDASGGPKTSSTRKTI